MHHSEWAHGPGEPVLPITREASTVRSLCTSAEQPPLVATREKLSHEEPHGYLTSCWFQSLWIPLLSLFFSPCWPWNSPRTFSERVLCLIALSLSHSYTAALFWVVGRYRREAFCDFVIKSQLGLYPWVVIQLFLRHFSLPKLDKRATAG